MNRQVTSHLVNEIKASSYQVDNAMGHVSIKMGQQSKPDEIIINNKSINDFIRYLKDK